jgi:hypothetical protein
VTLLAFLIGCLATYRVARMIGLEDGPGELFLSLRGWVCDRTANGWACRGITCPLCLSFWVGFAVAALLPWSGWGEYLLVALALSGAATIIHKRVN